MVRNAESMQSLRNSLGDLNVSAPQAQQHVPPQMNQQVQALNASPINNISNSVLPPSSGNGGYSFPPCATRAARPEDIMMWHGPVGTTCQSQTAAQVQEMPQQATTQGISSLYGYAGFNPQQLSSGLTPQQILAQQQQGDTALQNHQMQLMLLEQQNKKRLLLARQEQNEQQDEGLQNAQVHDTARASYSPCGHAELNAQRTYAPPQHAAAGPPSNGHATSSALTPQQRQQSAPALPPDYEMQLKFLEQQNEKRLALKRQEQDEQHKQKRQSSQERGTAKAGPNAPAVGRRRRVPAEQEKISLGYGTPKSTWETDHNPVLQKRQPECTAEENKQVEQMWKQYLADKQTIRRGSKGAAAASESARGDYIFPQATRDNAVKYTKPFCEWLTVNPTVFHAVGSMSEELTYYGFTKLSERASWDVKRGGKYFVERNGSSMIAFVVGEKYEPGNGAAILAGHVDALTAKLKPISEVPNKAGYLQLGVAPYAGALNSTWWDRDLGVGGRVLVKEGDKIVTKLVKLDWPIARIPTLAPHFGTAAMGPFNLETQMVPIIGLDDTDASATDIQTASDPFSRPSILHGEHKAMKSFVSTQPKALVKAIGDALGLSPSTYSSMINWELELFDVQPATVGGLNKEFIFAGRIDDKLCSWAAMRALIDGAEDTTKDSSVIKVVGWFDDEEIGSQLRQGAKSNFLPEVLSRAVHSVAKSSDASLVGRTFANSFIVSSDVTHAVNPNFLGAYLENHAPHLNVGLVVSADSNGHMTTDAVSTAILQRCADKVGAQLQVFQIRNDSRSGGTVGPMLSSMTGIRAIDAGIPQLSMHSIRATTGSLDPGLGVLAFTGFLNGFEDVDKEFRGGE